MGAASRSEPGSGGSTQPRAGDALSEAFDTEEANAWIERMRGRPGAASIPSRPR